MKKTKKLAALILALVMAFSLMAVTAAAYGADEHVHDGTCCEETIQPRKPAAPVCPYCGTVTTETGMKEVGGIRYIYYECYGCHEFETRIRF